MREYGQIQCSFWTDPDIQQLDDSAVLLAAYLLSGPHSNGIGCYRLPNGYIQADRGWDSKTVSKGFAELSQIGFAYRCEKTQFVFIPKFLRWNPVANGNVAKAREREFDSVPKKFSRYSELCESMLAYGAHWSEPFRNRLQTLSEGYIEQDPTQTPPDPITPPDGGVVPDGTPECPHKEIISLYHEILPGNPPVKVWNDERQKWLRTRWREDENRQSLEWWRRFFSYINDSCPFLTGQKEGNKGSFLPGLDWMVRPRNFANIVEGKYEERGEQ